MTADDHNYYRNNGSHRIFRKDTACTYLCGMFQVLTVCALLLVLCVMMPVTQVCAAEEYYSVDGLWWGFDKDTGAITWIPRQWPGGEIPSQIEGVTVRRLEEWACCNNEAGERDHVTSIIIPDSVTYIGNGAFWKCRIDKISIPDGVTVIDEQAFSDCVELKEIDLKEGLKEIGARAFRNCTALEKITIPKSVKSIGDYAFYSCENLETLIYAGKESDISFGKNVYNGTCWMHPDMSPAYKSSKYYRNLLNVSLTGDYVKDMIAIAASQEGYHEGDSESDLDGMNLKGTGDYTEYNYFVCRPEWLWRPGLCEVGEYGGWCGQFCGWCIAMAGIPDSAHQYCFRTDYETGVKWKDTTYAGGSYKLKPGDVVHLRAGHFAMVTGLTEKKNTVVIHTWNGNPTVEVYDWEYNQKDGTMTNGWTQYDIIEVLKFMPEVIDGLDKYRITFDANNGKTSIDNKQVIDTAYYGILPVPTRAGYTFEGWYTEKTGGKLVTPYKKVKHNGSITLYARWIEGGTAAGTDNGSEDDTGSASDTVVNAATSAVITSSRTKIKKADLKKADQTVILSVSDCDCTVKYKNATSGKLKKYVSVSKNGTVTISKGAPKGTVKIKVTLTPVKGGEKFTRTVKIKIK